MSKKCLLLSTVLYVLLFFGVTGEVLGDASEQFEQAGTHEKNKEYDQAEEIYQQILASSPDANDVLKAQKQLTCLYIAAGREAEADAAFGELTAKYAGHEDVAEAIWGVGGAYLKAKKYTKADETHRYNVLNNTADMCAMWSQVEIVYAHIRDGNDVAAYVAFSELLAVFANQPTLPKEIHQIAIKYSGSGQSEKAYSLHQYNVEHFRDYNGLDVIWSQSELIRLDVQAGRYESACAGADKLLCWAPDQNDLAREIHVTAKRFAEAGKHDKAYELYQYNVERFPHYKGLDVIWSQSELIRLDLEAGRYESACAGAAKLLGWPPDQNDLPREIHVTAKRFAEAGKHDKAYEFHQYNVEHFPKDTYAMWSQVEIVYSHIRDGNDAAADDAFNKLITVFADQRTLPKEIYQVGDEYGKARNYDKAAALYQHVIANWPGTEHEMWARTGNVRIDILAGDQAAVDSAIDGLIADFNDHPDLSHAIFVIGEEYYNVAVQAENEARAVEARGNFTKAIAIWDIIIEGLPVGVPHTAYAWYFSGVSYQRMGEYGNAIAYYQTVVDNWPDCEYAWGALFKVGRRYEEMMNSGLISKSQASRKIEVAYEEILERYPACTGAKHARYWLDHERNRY